MKKLFIAVLVGTAMFTSCKKYDVSEAITEESLNSLPEATIKGTVYAQLNETKANLDPVVGKTVRVVIAYSQYGLSGTGSLIRQDVTKSDGSYSIKVPAPTKGVTATVSFEEFEYDVPRKDANGNPDTIRKVFSIGNRTITGLGGSKMGDIKINEIYAASAANIDPNADLFKPTKRVEVSGRLVYVSRDTVSTSHGPEPSPRPGKATDAEKDTKVIVDITLTDAAGIKTYKETTFCLVGKDGEFKIQVPMVEMGKATVKLTGEAFWTCRIEDDSDGKKQEGVYRFELNQTLPTIYNTNTSVGDFWYKRGNRIDN